MHAERLVDIQRAGHGSARIVAVHGIQGTRAVWFPLAKRLADVATFTLPNLRGRGMAPRGATPADYSLDAFASEIVDVIDASIDGEPYCLAGWSMGVSVSLAALSRLRHLPNRLILMSGSPALCCVHWFSSDNDMQLAAEIAERKTRLGLRETADDQAVAWTWQAIRMTDQRAALDGVKVPTLIVHGSADADCPVEHARWVHEGLPDAQIEIIEGAGHSIPAENTNAVAEVVRRFLA
jgi:pimeloyl-ACP methyl ester carboxylesterase